jgi:hypothetical protein
VLLGAFGGDDRGDLHPPEGAGDPEELAADGGVVIELGEDAPERVEGDASGVDLMDGALDAGEEGPQVLAAGDDVRIARLGGGVDEGPLALGLPGGDVPAEAGHVASDVVGGLLEGDEDARLVGLLDAGGEELGGEDGLGAAGGARQQRGAAAGQAAVGDQIEALDGGGGAWRWPRRGPSRSSHPSSSPIARRGGP